MGNLCNDNSKETNAYHEFLSCDNILVITLPSMFLNLVMKYRAKNASQQFRLYTDQQSIPVALTDAVLVDNRMQGNYQFAKYVKQFVNPKAKFFVLVDGKYITRLLINNNYYKPSNHGKR